jgi:hypothetical protein
MSALAQLIFKIADSRHDAARAVFAAHTGYVAPTSPP